MTEQQDSGDHTEAAAPLETAVNDNVEGQPTQQEQHVPVEALQAERAKRQGIEDELRMIKDNMSLLMAQQQQYANQSQQKPPGEFEGLSDDDVLTVGELKKTLAQKEQQYNMSLQELKMTQKYPDYQETITKYLPEVFKTNPGLRNTLQQTQDFELAYYLAKNSDAYKSDNKRLKKNSDAERIVNNANQAGSLSSVGQNSPINAAKRYREMSDAEFRELANRNLGYS